jgi:hypothetical protein
MAHRDLQVLHRPTAARQGRGPVRAVPGPALHFTPTSASWMNQVETIFGLLTRQALRRGSFASVPDLVAAIGRSVAAWNADCHPFCWVKDADQILVKAASRRRQPHPVTRADEGSVAAPRRTGCCHPRRVTSDPDLHPSRPTTWLLVRGVQGRSATAPAIMARVWLQEPEGLRPAVLFDPAHPCPPGSGRRRHRGPSRPRAGRPWRGRSLGGRRIAGGGRTGGVHPTPVRRRAGRRPLRHLPGALGDSRLP